MDGNLVRCAVVEPQRDNLASPKHQRSAGRQRHGVLAITELTRRAERQVLLAPGVHAHDERCIVGGRFELLAQSPCRHRPARERRGEEEVESTHGCPEHASGCVQTRATLETAFRERERK